MKANERFGRWTVLGKREGRKILCRCECGMEKMVWAQGLKRGSSKSCGCRQMPPIKPGDRIGRWTVLGKREGLKVLCRCECGAEKMVRVHGLQRGSSKSCGCLQRELVSARRQKLVGGLQSDKHPLHPTWCSINQRCNNPSCKPYPRYGGRGIKVCPEWQGPDGFANFVADMGPRPKRATIDRIDNDGDYTPENCRWATPREQANNTRRNVILTIDGESLTISQWSRRSGIKVHTIACRARKGWGAKDAVFTPPRPGRPPASSQRG